MTKTPIIFYSTIFVLKFANFVGNFPATYAVPFTEYYNVKKSMVEDDQFQQELDYNSISKNKRHDYINSAIFEKCLQKISYEKRRFGCDEQLDAFSEKIKSNAAHHTHRMPHNNKAANYDEMLKSHHRNILHNWFRVKRELTSEISDDCETKLRQSFECYRNELANLAASLESQERNSLTTESRILHQNMAGCDLVDNILNKCDQLLCNPSSHSGSNVDTYNEYVRTVLPEFDVDKCATF